MNDTVFLHGLKVDTLIGVYDWERTRPQTILFDIDIHTDLSAAGASDEVDDTVHYGEVADTVRAGVKAQQFFLLEALAEYVATLILNNFRCERVRLRVVKPGILPDVREVGIVIERRRGAQS
ncbi:dihydroneopterin aldolase [Neisseria shayeganii]|uniref:7,8-dihydroneopterin aldolase n=1 Tax=Neisseria shayeganii TaxID=607712 RepID=A0A7D7NEK4_9NEIS|nr:dihydroneopterin aldolase [Neisseria shayeganii]QMT39794.1 dihydroneopterin aldolase [Neisseria shayeganii]